MRRALLLLFALAGLSLATVPASQAQFTECTQDYIDRFRVRGDGVDPAWSPGQTDCHEFFRFSFSTPAGPRWIRLIGDVNAARFLPTGGIDTIEDGARRATRQLSELGPYLIDDVTMLLAQPRSSPREPQPHGGYDDARAVRDDGPEFRACHITLLITVNHNASLVHQTVGHEVFHCVQYASLPEESVSPSAADWWAEGSAELFGVAAAGTAEGGWNRGAQFEAAVADDTPIYRMSYEASVLFAWLVAQDGMGGLMPFLRGMAREDGEQAQLRAMQAVRPTEFWSDFAQAYDDRELDWPTGQRIGFGQRIEGEVWNVSDDATHHAQQLWPFMVELGWIDYSCGVWENTVNRDFELRREDQRDWSPLPRRVDARDQAVSRYRLATLLTDDTAIDYTLDAEKTETCTECRVSRAIDRCLVGTWQMTSSPLDFFAGQLRGSPNIVIDNMGRFTLQLNPDGTLTQSSAPIDMTVITPGRDGPSIAAARGNYAPARGRWSAEANSLSVCFDSGGQASGTMSGQSPRMPRPLVMGLGGVSIGGEAGSTAYTCTDTTLTTTMPTSRGDMVTTFARQSPRRR